MERVYVRVRVRNAAAMCIVIHANRCYHCVGHTYSLTLYGLVVVGEAMNVDIGQVLHDVVTNRGMLDHVTTS